MDAKRVTTAMELDEAFRIRKQVFVEEQGVAPEIELDEHDSTADHVLVYHDNEPVGTARMRILDDTAKFERICVLAPYRRYGLGRVIMVQLEDMAKEKGISKAKLNSQSHAEGFYAKLGYQTVSPEFMEEGIPHVTMVKDLNKT